MMHRHIPEHQQRRLLLALGLLLVLVVFILICVGRYGVTPGEAFRIIWASAARRSQASDAFKVSVVMHVRLPRICMGLLVGMALSAAGTSYQAVFRNPLVSPDIIGVSSGASFGAALAILFSTETSLIQASALVFGLAAVVLVLVISHIKRGTKLFMIVLSGIIVKDLFVALVSLTKYTADPEDKLPAITLWLMGSLASVSFRDVLICSIVVLPCIAVLFGMRWKMNLLSLEEDEARSLGVNVKRLRLIVILLATMITGVTVSICGVIGWVGLVIPHMARLLMGDDHRTLFPASILIGGLYLLLIDMLARTVTSAEIPLSILTAFVGAPFFAWMLRRTTGGGL